MKERIKIMKKNLSKSLSKSNGSKEENQPIFQRNLNNCILYKPALLLVNDDPFLLCGY